MVHRSTQKEKEKLKNQIKATIDYESRNAMGGGVDALEDIYDALSGGLYRDRGTVK